MISEAGEGVGAGFKQQMRKTCEKNFTGKFSLNCREEIIFQTSFGE